MKRRTEITVEIDRVLVISQSRTPKSWCDTCGKQTSMAMVSEAAKMIQTTEAVICRLASTGKLHFSTPTDGLTMICLDSLLELLEDESISPPGKLLLGEGQNSG